MHIDYNQFNLLTMSNKKNISSVSIFAKSNAAKQIANHIASNQVNGSFNLTTFLDKNKEMDYLTQDDSKDNRANTQKSDENSPDSRSYDDDSTESQKQESITNLLDYSDSEEDTKTNDDPNSSPKPKRRHITDQKQAPPVITPQPKNTNKQKKTNEDATKKIYSSPFLDENYKLTSEEVDLTLELEPLRKLIMSQHKVFADWIKELGHISLSLSKVIEKKKESVNELKKDKKIPRSLRIKCELTSSPDFANDEGFLQFKEELQDTVTEFVKKGTNIMIGWAERNLTLLIQQRCFKILKKGLQILDGLISFYSEGIGTPRFLSLPSEKCNNLFLLKLYLSKEYIDIQSLTEYLGLPAEEILLTGAKILTDNTSNEDVSSMIRGVKLSDIDVNNKIHENFITETLLSFDQIMKVATVDIWTTHKEKSKQTIAAQNLLSKITSEKMIKATNATAQAITKATENINYSQSLNLNNNLRISNLEKSIRKHEQKTNEIIKSIQNKQSSQKNSNGSYTSGSVASPETTIPQKRKNTEKKVNFQQTIDLTVEKTEDAKMTSQRSHNQRSTHKQTSKRHKRQTSTPRQETGETEKIIQWKENEIASYNPHQPVAFAITPQPNYIPFPPHNHYGLPPYYQVFPPPPLPSFTHQLQSPFLNSQLMTGNSSHQGCFRATYPQQPQWNTSQQTHNKHASNNGPAIQNNPFRTQFQ
jgi:hypothetical protein